jgi:hypothetical protein
VPGDCCASSEDTAIQNVTRPATTSCFGDHTLFTFGKANVYPTRIVRQARFRLLFWNKLRLEVLRPFPNSSNAEREETD